MKIRFDSECTIRYAKIGSSLYRFSRDIDMGYRKYPEYREYREITAQKWNGQQWTTVHRWTN